MATEDSMTDQRRTTGQILGAFRRELTAQGLGFDEVDRLVYRAAERLIDDGDLRVAAEVPAVEVTPPVAVGDVLTTQEDYDRAPHGTITRDLTDHFLVKKGRGWLGACGRCETGAIYSVSRSHARTVLYVPPVTA